MLNSPKTLSFALLLLVVLATSANAQQKIVRLKGTISPEVGKARQLARLSKNEEVQFSITLPVRKQAELDDYLKHLYTPGDRLYRQYLLTGEFAELFGPTQEDYDKAIEFAKRSGLRIVATHSNRMLLDVAGSAAVVEKALSVRLMHFQAPNGRIFRAPDQEPAFPEDVAAHIKGVVGLENAIEPHPNWKARPPKKIGDVTPDLGTGPAGLAPADIKLAYNLNGLTQDGTGQSVAILEFDGFYPSDIRAYENYFHLPNSNITVISVGDTSGFPTAPTSSQPNPPGVIECALDIELVNAIAPNANIVVYEGTNLLDVLNLVATDNTCKVVSMSWGFGLDSSPSQSTRDSENSAFQQMAAQGQSFYCSSGDVGDKTVNGKDSNGNPNLQFGVADPVAQPYVTGVGATTLSLKADNTYSSEAVWSNMTGASGGGVSTIWPLPLYQSTAVSPGSSGSASFRNVPDVSLNGDPNTGYSVYVTSGYPTSTGGWAGIGGTSASTPLWAAYTALVNQNRAGLGTGNLGFANPTIYFMAHAHFASDFHDITTGNNGTYSAVPGYDNATGWGSFNGGNMFSDLTRDAAVFWVDGSYTGSLSNGGQTTPFKTISDALNTAVNEIPTLIYIRGGAYNETFNTSKPIVFVNNGNGNVTLGSSTVK
jgi:kumamolisin